MNCALDLHTLDADDEGTDDAVWQMISRVRSLMGLLVRMLIHVRQPETLTT